MSPEPAPPAAPHGWKGPRRLLLLAAWGAGVAVLLGGAVHYSESPHFCRSCHIMDPYYAAWKTSKHNTVRCVECHYPPGTPQTLIWKKFQALSQVAKYVTRTYSSKPFAEVEDASCLRSGCHSTRLLEGKVRVKGNGVKFDHRPHLTQVRRDRQLRCVSCHSQVVVGKHIEVTYDTCYLCHFKGKGEGRDMKPLGGCAGCHDLPKKDFQLAGMTYNHRDFAAKRHLACTDCHVDVVKGKGEAPQDRCFTCHNQPEKLARYADIPFLHENHVTRHNIACFHCHQEIRHGLAMNGKAGKSGAKAAAHAPLPGLAFDCGHCHQAKHTGQQEMYSGQAQALGLPSMPSPMHLAQVDCVGCHYKQEGAVQVREFSGVNFKASEQACLKCHGEKFKGIWEETKSELDKSLAELRAKEAATQQALSKADAPAAKKAEPRLAEASRLLAFVRSGKGEHNIYLASEALRRADTALAAAGTAIGAGLPDVSGLPLLSGAYCATLCHRKVGVKVPPETVRAFGKTMPHKAHTQNLDCIQCHRIGAHKQVPLRKDVRSLCGRCHPA